MRGQERSHSPNVHGSSPTYDILDHKNPKNQSFGSTRNTFNIKTMSQFYRQSKYPKLPKKSQFSVWQQSATSMTRGHSPQHKIPQQKRFTSIQQDRARSTGDANKLNLRTSLKLGQSFACSKRKTYFPPDYNQQNPAPWVYGLKRWLEQQDSSTLSPNKTVDAKDKNRNRKCYSSVVRGRTMTKEVRDNSKFYLDHARLHVNHHEQIVSSHPGVGRYTISTTAGKHKPAYKFGQLLKPHKDDFPAPNAYVTNAHVPKPSTQKQTFDRGKRLDLEKPLNQNPGPSEYIINRYLQNKNNKSK